MFPPKQNVGGVKRKRLQDEGSEDSEPGLHQRLQRALGELCKVVKKARAFEVQRTLKKLKDARRRDPENDMTKDLVAQMAILKHLNYDQLARSAFITKVKKDKILSAETTIQAALAKLSSNLVSPGPPGTPTAKVQSRILSSKVLASEIISILETLRASLRPSIRLEANARDTTVSSCAGPNTSKKRRTRSGPERYAFTPSDNVADPSGDDSDWKFGSTSGDEAGTELDDGWESGTVGAPSESNDSVAGGADDHGSTYENSGETDFPSEDPKGKNFQPQGSNGQSEFLPSLSVGFVRGNSGSDFSDSEAKLVDGIKKNRRGQRARRAIWEKKFGKNANYVKQLQQSMERRQPSSVPVDRRSAKGNPSLSSRSRRTLTESRAPAYGNERVRAPIHKVSQGITDPGSAKGRSGNRDDGFQRERPLHPSWEARRKQKSAGIVPSQGTKIIFS